MKNLSSKKINKASSLFFCAFMAGCASTDMAVTYDANGSAVSQADTFIGSDSEKHMKDVKKVGVLSGGEKTRLAMVKLLLEPVNVLILDEPTNHLDLKSKDVLKEALLEFDGTLILVSHDRDFLQGLANKVFEFKNQRVIEHFETIDAFLERNKIETIKDLDL